MRFSTTLYRVPCTVPSPWLGWRVHGRYSSRSNDPQCFSIADQVVAAARNVGRLQAWLPPGESRRGKDVGRKGPLEVLTEALDWFTRQGYLL
jgi:hypothetical protein